MTLAMVGSSLSALRVALRHGARLNAVERGRAQGYKNSEARAMFVAAHLLARVCLGQATGKRPNQFDLIQACPSCGGPHGRPAVDGPVQATVSISHSDGYVAAVASPAREPVGIDVEPWGAHPRLLAASHRILTSQEVELVRNAADPDRQLLSLWVRKEALIKIGEGSLDELTDLFVSADRREGSRHQLYDFCNEQCVGAVASTTAPTFIWL